MGEYINFSFLIHISHAFHMMRSSINAVGVDIAPFSAMKNEAEVLLLPGLPLTNGHGENPEPGLWTFDIETPGVSVSGNGDTPPVMIDYVHPGDCWYSMYWCIDPLCESF